MIRMRRAGGYVVSAAMLLFVAPVSRAQDSQPEKITLTEAIRRAQANEPIFAAAVAAGRSAKIDSYLAKAALLPSVTYHNQMLYTQPNGQTNQGGQAGTQASPIFIANNAVHEYTSQAVINETVGLKGIADAQVASAVSARAQAEAEIARRGLTSAVVNLYYMVYVAARKQTITEEGLAEAQSFAEITQKREAGREVARADVVKAQLQLQGRQRDLADAKLAADKARLELAVLLFPDPRTPYVTDAPQNPPELPTRDEVNKLASTNNPEIRSALADLTAANASVRSARAGYLPDLGLNFTYGLDAPQFAKRGPEDVRNLGYSISGTLDIPVWDWFSTQKKIQQSQIQRNVAKVSLTSAQRRLIANLEESYAEASAARNQLTLLEQSAQTAAESLRLTRLRYAAGESTVLEVVDAQNALLTAQTAQADGVVRYESALSALQILTGTL